MDLVRMIPRNSAQRSPGRGRLAVLVGTILLAIPVCVVGAESQARDAAEATVGSPARVSLARGGLLAGPRSLDVLVTSGSGKAHAETSNGILRLALDADTAGDAILSLATATPKGGTRE